jgi:transposase
MSETKEYSNFEKWIVTRMYLKGDNTKEITKKTGMSYSTQWIIRKYEDEDGYHALGRESG